MAVPNINPIKEVIPHEDLVNEVAKLQKMVRYLLTKGLESDNIIEVGNWIVEADQLVADDGDVGLSTADTAADDVRIWAGDKKDGTPKFKVTKSGILTAVSAILMSALGYPRVELNSINNLIGAYADADTYIAFIPNASGVPTLVLVDAGTTKGFMNRGSALAGTAIGTFDNEPLNLQPHGPLQIGGVNGWSGNVSVVTAVDFAAQTTASKTITVTKGIITNVT